jgi:hypothetical protein
MIDTSDFPYYIPPPEGKNLIKKLPNELLDIVFKFLKFNDEQSVSLVCQRWRDQIFAIKKFQIISDIKELNQIFINQINYNLNETINPLKHLNLKEQSDQFELDEDLEEMIKDELSHQLKDYKLIDLLKNFDFENIIAKLEDRKHLINSQFKKFNEITESIKQCENFTQIRTIIEDNLPEALKIFPWKIFLDFRTAADLEKFSLVRPELEESILKLQNSKFLTSILKFQISKSSISFLNTPKALNIFKWIKFLVLEADVRRNQLIQDEKISLRDKLIAKTYFYAREMGFGEHCLKSICQFSEIKLKQKYFYLLAEFLFSGLSWKESIQNFLDIKIPFLNSHDYDQFKQIMSIREANNANSSEPMAGEEKLDLAIKIANSIEDHTMKLETLNLINVEPNILHEKVQDIIYSLKYQLNCFKTYPSYYP